MPVEQLVLRFLVSSYFEFTQMYFCFSLLISLFFFIGIISHVKRGPRLSFPWGRLGIWIECKHFKQFYSSVMSIEGELLQSYRLQVYFILHTLSILSSQVFRNTSALLDNKCPFCQYGSGANFRPSRVLKHVLRSHSTMRRRSCCSSTPLNSSQACPGTRWVTLAIFYYLYHLCRLFIYFFFSSSKILSTDDSDLTTEKTPIHGHNRAQPEKNPTSVVSSRESVTADNTSSYGRPRAKRLVSFIVFNNMVLFWLCLTTSAD